MSMMETVKQLLLDLVHTNLKSVSILSGIVLLNTPVLIVRAEPGSLFHKLRSIEPFKHLDQNFLDTELSFSPRNLKNGKWHTLITSLFNHAGGGHLLGNILLLIGAAPPVINLTGIGHFITLYLGGGVTGNLVLFGQYIVQRYLWRDTLPDYSSWWLLGGYIESVKQSSMTTIYNAVNERRPIVGASGCVSAVLGFYSVALSLRLWRYCRKRDTRRSLDVLVYQGPKVAVFADKGVLLSKDAFIIGYAITQFKQDFSFFLNDFRTSSQSLVDGVVAYSADGVGHGSHFGGFLFGVLYYSFYHRKYLGNSQLS